MIERAPAKVNLFLEVLGKRPDGYHELTTLMAAVGLFDTLEFTKAPTRELSLRLAASSPSTDQHDPQALFTGSDNLIIRAAELLRRRTGCDHGARIRLHKRIPLQAGLAGGSSDAAAALRGLNRLWRLGLTRKVLTEMGAELGSDVPFFFHAPAAWCTGRGEIVTPTRVGRPFWLVLIRPPTGLSTAAIFAALTIPERPVSGDGVRWALETGDVERLGSLLHNRLQEPARALCPALTEIERNVDALAPVGRLMTGSGSTCFALCQDQSEASRFAERLARFDWVSGSPRLFVTRICI